MEREVSYVTWLAVGLISVAAVISLVLFTVWVGKGAGNDVADDIVDTTAQIESGEIKSMVNTTEDLTMAGIYSIMTRNYKDVTSFVIYDAMAANSGTTANAIKFFKEHEMDMSSQTITGSGINRYNYIVNGDGHWTLNGDTSVSGPMYCYDILSNNGWLSGRGYITINKNVSGTYEVTILKYQ